MVIRGFSLSRLKVLLGLAITYSSLRTALSDQLPIISDGSAVDLTLMNYNVSDPNRESPEVMYTIMPQSSCVIHVTLIPEAVHFVVVQVHSYMKNMTLSSEKKVTQKTSISGYNIGLLKMNVAPVLSFYLFYNSSSDNATVLITAQAYGVNAPIPGGCNMEFQVEISPFLKVASDKAMTIVDFAPAAPLLLSPTDLPSVSENMCNLRPSPLKHTTYRMYLPERDFSEEVYFQSLRLMMTERDILQNGRSAPDKYGIAPTRHYFASYPGTGSVYVVIAETSKGSSVYVPAVSYSCNLNSDDDCRVLTATFSKVFCAAIFFFGLFACFAAHRFFVVELSFLGFVTGAYVSYVALNVISGTNALVISVAIGCAVGAALILLRCCRILPLVSLLVSTSILGYLMASTIFYKLVDAFDVFQSDLNYWSLFCSILLLFPINLISLSERANIAACAMTGSYVAVVAIDYYIGGNLRYMIINTIRRATVRRFEAAIIDPPFQMKDYVLIGLWTLLSLIGIASQMRLIRGKPPYPAPYNIVEKIRKRLRLKKKTPDERTPLLRSPLA